MISVGITPSAGLKSTYLCIEGVDFGLVETSVPKFAAIGVHSMPNLAAVGTREVSEMRAGLTCGSGGKRVGLLLRTPLAAHSVIVVLLP